MIEVKGLSHAFRMGKKGKEQVVPVLKDVSFSVAKSEIVAVVGRSGSGKSTLLNLLSGYIQPNGGQIVIAGKDVTALTEKQWAKFRLDTIGFIFQSFQLIPGLTTFENIELPLTLGGVDKQERKARVEEVLQKVGLEPYAGHYPNELSGGQQQRVSIARALVTKPQLILADEPTGSLDSETEKEVLDFIQSLRTEYGITFVIITHDEQVAAIADRKLRLADGVLQQGGVLLEV